MWILTKPGNTQIPLTKLCKLALKYGSDKCPRVGHCYTPFYWELLKKRRFSIRKVLEVGVGHSGMKKCIPMYTVGASLFMWRDFFPYAQIYGADICQESIFTAHRLTTYYCDEKNPEDIKRLISLIGADIDLVVDDASHRPGNQMFLFQNLMPILGKGVTYIVEDCQRTGLMKETFSQYNCYIPTLPPNEHPVVDGIAVFTNN